jgi:uncharacterized peroxidase-related enzyme
MTRLNPIESRQIGPEVRASLDKLQLSSTEVPNFLRVVAKSLAAMRAYAGMEHALARGQLTAKERQQIALAVAEINGCSYSLISHSRTAQEAALSDEDIRLARKAAAADARANAMLRFTQAVVLQRGEISDTELALVRQAGFSESEIIEIIANIALSIFTNYLNIISKTEADFLMPQAHALAETNGYVHFSH